MVLVKGIGALTVRAVLLEVVGTSYSLLVLKYQSEQWSTTLLGYKKNIRMARKPEAVAVSNLHTKLDSRVYHEGMANPYRGGTPDVWYDGNKSDLWVEYKFIPKASPVVIPNLSALQTKWLNRAYDNGRNVAVITLMPGKLGGYLYRDKQWNLPMKREIFMSLLLSRQQLADWISDKVLLKPGEENETKINL